MKNLSNISYFFFGLLLAVTSYAFLRLFNDSMDLDIGGFGRNRFLNNAIPKFLIPATIIVFAFWINQVFAHFKTFESESKYNQKPMTLPPVLWWIPVLNFFGPVIFMNELLENAGRAEMEAAQIKKLRSGSSWIKTSFILFYTLAILGFLFYYFYETNKDGHDFFLNMLFIFLITFSIGAIKMTAVLRK